MCNGYNRQWQQWTTVRRWQARAAKTTADIEGTQQWAAADGGLVGCEVEVAATTTVAMLLRSRRQDWVVDCARRVCGCVQGMAGGGQHDERGRWIMQGKQAGGGQHGKRGGADNARRASGGQQDERTGAEDTTQGGSGGRATRPPLCAAWGGPSRPPPGAAWGGQRDMVIILYVVANRLQLVTCS
jgi:hypothetical protein